MSEERAYPGRCFCGEVQFEVRGEPIAMGYCHCESCRHWSAEPVHAFTLWQHGHVRITAGEDNIRTYHKTERSHRKWCRSCGGHVLVDHPGMSVVDVPAAVIPDFPFEPTVHVYYAESRLPIRDGLPKMKDMPAEMGGSGETLAE